ncbi:MAG: sirohydrochlorin chelatase [Sciscionella sp.]
MTGGLALASRRSRHAAPPLVAVAHGSRDPRSAATIMRMLGMLRSMRPELDVRAAFLDLSAPRLGDVLGVLHAEGHREVVVVPLLLGAAYHARIDIPGVVAGTVTTLPRLRVTVADVLGPDPRLEEIALRRLAEAGVDRTDEDFGVILAGAGSSHAPANAAVAAIARRWHTVTRWQATGAAFAAAADPGVAAATSALRAAGARRIALGSWFLAPGLLPDRVIAQAGAGTVIAAPLGAHPQVAATVLDRYAEAQAAPPKIRSA